MEAGQAAVRDMPPPCTPHALAVTLPQHIAERLPPPGGAGAAPTAVHTPLRDWTCVWPPGQQVP